MRAAPIEAALRWASRDAQHCERFHFPALAIDPERLPAALAQWLPHAAAGETLTLALSPGELAGAHDAARILTLAPEKLRQPLVDGIRLVPRVGRYYPRALLYPLPGCGERDLTPFRCLHSDAERIEVDLNHPLAGVSATLEATMLGTGSGELPATNLVQALIADGPGMQATLAGGATDFADEGAYLRADEANDTAFYARPRLVPHLDSTALARLAAVYRRFRTPGMRVLDLMSSWQSHLPDELPGLQVTGVGLNAEELAANPRLARRLIHDLNREPRLPFGPGEFDLALCSLSVEYLLRPIELFAEAARVLKPGAAFVLSFSQRWFPPKAVRIWTHLHPFERIGLVLDYFKRSAEYRDAGSESLRGLPRPRQDRYAGRVALSDPLYAVWARRRGR